MSPTLEDQNSDLYNSPEEVKKRLAAMEQADPGLADLNRDINQSFEEAEKQGSWRNNTSPQTPKNPQQVMNFVKTTLKQKGGVIGVGGGIIILLMMGLLFFLPNQLKMAVEVITESAARVPGYAVEHRSQYLLTRYIATRILGIAGGRDFDQKVIFCKNSSITCSLASTKFAEAFDKRFKLDVKPTVKGASVSITPKGRTGLGGKAMNWDITYSRTSSLDGSVRSITKSINSNKEMKAFLRTETKKLYKKGFMSRFVGKRILMKKYGVTHFRAFEKTSNRVKRSTAEFSAKITSATVGKILPKMPVYFACLEGGSSIACEQAITKAVSMIDDNIAKIDKEIEKSSPEKKESLGKKKEGLSQLKQGIVSPDMDGKTGKIIGKNLLTKVAGPLAVASIVDLIARIVNAADDHILEVISYDIMGQAYIGMAYGEETGIVPAVDQATVGESSMEDLGLLTSMFSGMGASPLYQYRTDQFKYSRSNSYMAECEVEGKRMNVALPAGELVCPEEKMVKSILGFTNDPWWPMISIPAKVWKDTGGLVFDAIGWVVGPAVQGVFAVFGAITDLPGLSSIKGWSMELFQQGLEWAINAFFGIPDIGMAGSSTANFTALDGGITQSFNDTMKFGIDPSSGEVMGAGGTVLNNQQVSAITNSMLEDEKEQFDSRSTLAKIFDVNLRGSVFNKLALTMPRNFTGFLSLTPKLYTSMNSAMSNEVFAANEDIYNPHGFPLYGYSANDEVLTADPDIYTKEFCEESAKKREESYKIPKGEVLPRYTISDPCALERVAMGNLLNSMDIYDDENSLQEPSGGGASATESSPSESASGDDLPPVEGYTWPIKDQLRPGPCWNRPVMGRLHAGMDINSGKANAPLYAMHDATVIKTSTAGGAAGNHIIFKSTDGLYFIYQHMSSISVKAGQTVKANQFVGNGGKTGNVEANSPVHLHLVVSREDPSRPGQFPSYGSLKSSINPMSVLPKPAPDGYKCT